MCQSFVHTTETERPFFYPFNRNIVGHDGMPNEWYEFYLRSSSGSSLCQVILCVCMMNEDKRETKRMGWLKPKLSEHIFISFVLWSCSFSTRAYIKQTNKLLALDKSRLFSVKVGSFFFLYCFYKTGPHNYSECLCCVKWLIDSRFITTWNIMDL